MRNTRNYSKFARFQRKAMQVVSTKVELDQLRSALPKDKSVGLVPTMGALHQGHLSLVERALKENNFVFVSIFVNPTQFGDKEDLEKYPKTLAADIALLEKKSKSILIFAPTVAEMYPNKVHAKHYDFGVLENTMEGAHRKGHFDGVATIVEALFTAVKPNNAYFGEKDYQQLLIIKRMVAQEKLPVRVIGCPIVREKNGLALSSRNERLPKRLRKEAGFIFDTLLEAKTKFGTNSANYVTQWVRNKFASNSDFDLEYVEIADDKTLVPVKRKSKNKKYRIFVAVYAAKVRLIDNLALN